MNIFIVLGPKMTPYGARVARVGCLALTCGPHSGCSPTLRGSARFGRRRGEDGVCKLVCMGQTPRQRLAC